ncbi:hypothetical protein QFC21_006332 [Naganishia friedmannii]|uniref:Uncharacterized protein n=1 Tax=Naganishia friedmannii TaxID=89922 RepID=A0ACC2V4G8_9TREE|nr:hypothetical protein QFC21_006332 [Naganishia friedmannii]
MRAPVDAPVASADTVIQSSNATSENDTNVVQFNDFSDSASDSSEDSVLSFDGETETQEEDTAQHDRERSRKERERMRIIESAGLHLKQEPAGAPPARAKRRMPPAAPTAKRFSTMSGQSTSSLALPPQRPNYGRAASRNSVTSLGPDAYDRYEAYLEKAKNIPLNRTRSQSDARPPSMTANDKVAPMQVGSPSSSTFTLGSFSRDSKLAGFMNKLSTPATPDRKSTATISGPINIIRMEEGDDNTPSHGMGPTWSSLVDSELLANLGDKERKRQEAMFEFITTEGAYFFYAPMLQMLEDSVTSGIFSNLEDILLFNTGLLSSLEDRQRACRLYIDRIGDILSAQLPNVQIYKEYCMNQSQAISRLQTLREQDGKVAEHLQIMKYGEEADELVQLDTALMSTEKVLAEVNESVRQAENLERLRVLSEDLWIGGEGIFGPKEASQRGLGLEGQEWKEAAARVVQRYHRTFGIKKLISHG